MSIEITSEEVGRIALFANLAPQELVRVASAARSLAVAAGETVIGEGEFAFDVYAVARGAVEVRCEGGTVAALAAGEVFGELSVVSGPAGPSTRRRTASVVASEPSELIVIDGTVLRRLAEEIPALRVADAALGAARSR